MISYRRMHPSSRTVSHVHEIKVLDLAIYFWKKIVFKKNYGILLTTMLIMTLRRRLPFYADGEP